MNERSVNLENGKRQAKARETERRLVDAALALFSEKGFEAVSVKEIAQAAGVAQGSLYTYFPSKEHLFWGILDRYSFAPLLKGLMAEAAGRPAREVLTLAARGFHDFLAERQALMRLIVGGAQTDPRVADLFARYVRAESQVFHADIERRIDTGELRPHDPEITLRMLIAPILLLHLMGPPRSGDIDAYLAGIVETILRGLRPE